MIAKILIVIGVLAMGFVNIGRTEIIPSAVERVGNVLGTLKTAPKLPSNWVPILAYGRTSGKSGTQNRAVGILPFLEYGFLDAVIIGGTPGMGDGSDKFWDNKGVLGGGGGVSFDRILIAAFPEMMDFFSGPLPLTNGKATWAIKAGIGEVWDFTASEAAVIGYIGPQLAF